MCGSPNTGPVPSSGDLIAVIHPVQLSPLHTLAPPPPSPRYRANYLLRLSNSHASATTTSDFSCDGWAVIDDQTRDRIEVRIHKYGNLAHSARGPAHSAIPSTNPVVHTFFIDGSGVVPPGTVVRTCVGRKLGLGAGDEGVVGRTVSILDQEKTVIGEGIIGWA